MSSIAAKAKESEPPPPTQSDVFRALCRLPSHRQRMVTLLAESPGWSYVHIGLLLDLEPEQVRDIRVEAREQMRRILNEVVP